MVSADDHGMLQAGGLGRQRLEALANSGELRRACVRIDRTFAEENTLHIRLMDEAAGALEGKNLAYLLSDGETEELLKVEGRYDSGANEIVLDSHCLDVLRDYYFRKPGTVRLWLWLMEESESGSIYYELVTHKDLPKENNYDKYARHEVILPIAETEDGPIALVTYFAQDGCIQFLIKEQKQVFSEICVGKVRSIRIVKDVIRLAFRLPKTDFALKSVSLILRSKVQNKRYDFQLTVKERENHLDVTGILPLAEIAWEQFYWDIRGIVTRDGVEYELRLRNYSKIKRLWILLRNQQTFLQDGNYVVYPYLTKSRDFAFMYRARTAQDCRQFVWKEYLALFLFYLLRPYWLSRKYWLVYEKYSITAQDNSYYFFQYCMEKLPAEEKKNIYYVIDKRAPDYQYVKQYGRHVIQFLSLKHMIYLKAAQLLVSSDTKAHAYAWHSPNTVYREMLKRNKNAFLQHGVIYYKQCHQGLKKSGTNNCRLFIVSSEVEKQIIKDYFGYRDDEIGVTGLARWDVLHDTSVPGEKLILMMPTWRNWLEEVTEEEFRNSDYYQHYMALLNNPKLHSFLERKQVNMIFYIHPKFREYISAFATSSPYIQMVEFGSQPLNALIMKCNMMVTDYSSACWDVYYQGKPTLFYLFDYELYSQVQGSYVDMRTEAFGDATGDADELIRLMEVYEENGFREAPQYARMREKLLPYRDDCNCERTYRLLKEKFPK